MLNQTLIWTKTNHVQGVSDKMIHQIHQNSAEYHHRLGAGAHTVGSYRQTHPACTGCLQSQAQALSYINFNSIQLSKWLSVFYINLFKRCISFIIYYWIIIIKIIYFLILAEARSVLFLFKIWMAIVLMEKVHVRVSMWKLWSVLHCLYFVSLIRHVSFAA